MVKEQQGKWVVPNPQIPRSFGLMNIIFGCVLAPGRAGIWLLVHLHADVHAAVRDLGAGSTGPGQGRNAEKIAELKKQEAEAKTAEEKVELKLEREAIESAIRETSRRWVI